MNQVVYGIGVFTPITPSEPLPPIARHPPRLAGDRGGPGAGGRAMTLHQLHGSPAAAIAGLLIRA